MSESATFSIVLNRQLYFVVLMLSGAAALCFGGSQIASQPPHPLFVSSLFFLGSFFLAAKATVLSIRMFGQSIQATRYVFLGATMTGLTLLGYCTFLSFLLSVAMVY